MTVLSEDNRTQGRSSMSVKLRTISALHTTISLSIIIEDIYKSIYGLTARKKIRENPVSGDRTRLDLWYRLVAWERDLPPSLTLDLEHLSSVPGVVTNVVVMVRLRFPLCRLLCFASSLSLLLQLHFHGHH